jgi:hypothetical protein
MSKNKYSSTQKGYSEKEPYAVRDVNKYDTEGAKIKQRNSRILR